MFLNEMEFRNRNKVILVLINITIFSLNKILNSTKSN